MTITTESTSIHQQTAVPDADDMRVSPFQMYSMGGSTVGYARIQMLLVVGHSALPRNTSYLVISWEE